MIIVTKNGEPLSELLYSWDKDCGVFLSDEEGLEISTDRNNCLFKVGDNCTFNTGFGCIFDAGNNCTFNTTSMCTFDTGESCTFNTGTDCVFRCSSDCVIETGGDSIVLRRDIYEVIELERCAKIRLNEYMIEGYSLVNREVKDIKLNSQIDNLQKQIDDLKLKLKNKDSNE